MFAGTFFDLSSGNDDIGFFVFAAHYKTLFNVASVRNLLYTTNFC